MEPHSRFAKGERGVSIWNFPKKEGGTDFSHKKGGVGKIGGRECSKKGVITYFHTGSS